MSKYTRQELKNTRKAGLLKLVDRQKDLGWPKIFSVATDPRSLKVSELVQVLTGPYGYCHVETQVQEPLDTIASDSNFSAEAKVMSDASAVQESTIEETHAEAQALKLNKGAPTLPVGSTMISTPPTTPPPFFIQPLPETHLQELDYRVAEDDESSQQSELAATASSPKSIGADDLSEKDFNEIPGAPVARSPGDLSWLDTLVDSNKTEHDLLDEYVKSHSDLQAKVLGFRSNHRARKRDIEIVRHYRLAVEICDELRGRSFEPGNHSVSVGAINRYLGCNASFITKARNTIKILSQLEQDDQVKKRLLSTKITRKGPPFADWVKNRLLEKRSANSARSESL